MYYTPLWKHFRDSTRIDGTSGTWDFRIVSALYLILRIAVVFAYSGNDDSFDHAYGWLTTAVVFVSTALFFSNVSPYKVDHSNIVDSLLLALLSIQGLICLFVKYLPDHRFSHIIGVTRLLTIGIPHAAPVLYILYTISKKIRILECLKRKWQCLMSIVCWNKPSLDDGNHGHNHGYRVDTDSLPDRLVNPDEYEPLVPAVNPEIVTSEQCNSCDHEFTHVHTSNSTYTRP